MPGVCEKVKRILCLKQIPWGTEFHGLTTHSRSRKEASKLFFKLVLFLCYLLEREASFLFIRFISPRSWFPWPCCSTGISTEKFTKCFISKSILLVLSVPEGCPHCRSSVHVSASVTERLLAARARFPCVSGCCEF